MQLARSVLVGLLCLAVFAHGDPRESETKMGFDDVDLNTNTLVQTKRGYALDLEHSISLDGSLGKFSPRGEVAIDFEKAKPSVTFSNKLTLNDAQRDTFIKLLSRNGLYTIRARSEPGNPNSPYVVASVPTCFLVKSRFRDDLSFHVNDVGHLIGIEFRTSAVSADECESIAKRAIKDVSFNSVGSVAAPVDGPEVIRLATPVKVAVPPGVQPVHDANAPPTDEDPSFFRKYWYIIVPVLLLLLVGGGDAPPAQGGAGGGGAARR
ncbi:unnamed protein product [Aphanomyces euteiches]|uniref:ER membrane protein complex subunit 10 n=1 Tax=Aphanomyces euteiches TaxID=100861 RepID=A0A6G0XW53_9STRA|nr:hypothetical protein Ae201684_000536 [Aphanomyces euteiches]KAH9091850.1 hypothetical protein Ae201684P_011393 [Aphanomyces euteiches]KAH9140362.1 hypothetical protein AeRB84_015404 [Aphanomyces euteiches]